MSARTISGAALAAVALVALSFFWPASEVARAKTQPRRPNAGLTPIAATDVVPAGSSTRLALQVSLPESYHVQSNAPREAAFIPTVLAVEAPAGYTVDEIVYPAATDLKQRTDDRPHHIA